MHYQITFNHLIIMIMYFQNKQKQTNAVQNLLYFTWILQSIEKRNERKKVFPLFFINQFKWALSKSDDVALSSLFFFTFTRAVIKLHYWYMYVLIFYVFSKHFCFPEWIKYHLKNYIFLVLQTSKLQAGFSLCYLIMCAI